jgi:hypothetical protein
VNERPRHHATRPRRLLPLAAALGLLAACGPAPRLGERKPGGGAGGGSGTYAEVAQRVLVPACATDACHGGASPLFSPTYDLALGWAANVGVDSLGVPGMKLVEPGSPEASYLVHKCRGTHGSVGGGGARMPPGGALADADQDLLENWILNGAPND